ncbi:hypothetical protein H6F89_23005 [Cyanobacteria bacterium FACHB-63]|nr:hypothetical protein [Cyanobacteria bacterium FACHB-63]
MRSTLVLTVGTTPGSVCIDIYRRIQRELDRLQQQNSVLLKQRGAFLKKIRLLAIDIDATHTYPCHVPLHNTVRSLQPDQLLHCKLPNEDLLKTIELGRRSGHTELEHYENLNPHSTRALRGAANAAGGNRPNGYAAVKVNQEAIKERLQRGFQAARLEQSVDRGDEPMRVILVASTFGGFASGSLHLLEQLVLEIAASMNLEIDLTCILMIPGGSTVAKDIENSRANTVAVFKDRAAIATEYHVHRQRVAGKVGLETVRSKPVKTILISDTNHASNAQGLKVESLISMVSELILTLETTSIGARLAAQSVDFETRSRELTLAGEPKFASSIGLATIDLGRDRLEAYSKLRLSVAFIDRFLHPLAIPEIEESVLSFLVQQRLLVGQGQRDLLDRLLDEIAPSGCPLTIQRTIGLLEQSLQSLPDTAQLTQGTTATQLAFRQALQPYDDLNQVFEERRSAVLQSCKVQLEQKITAWIQELNKGLCATRQFLEQLLKWLDRIQTGAVEDIVRFDDEVNQCQECLDSFAAQVPECLEEIERKRQAPFYRFRSAQIEQEIASQLQPWNSARSNAFNRYYSAMISRAAHLASIETLVQLQQIVSQLLNQIEQAERSIADLRTQLTFDQQRLIHYRPEFECPNGFCLHETESDLSRGYQRILPKAGEACAIERLINPLLDQSQLLSFLIDPIEFKAQLLLEAGVTLQPQLSGLHVVTELYHRFPQETELGRVLKQLDRQSFEFIELKGSCDQEHGTFVIRLLGIDKAHQRNVPQLLNWYSSRERGYQEIDTGDPDKIIFLQYRAVLPYSYWAHYPIAVQNYHQIAEVTYFEKFHPIVGARYLPFPGQDPTIEQAEIAVIYAWILGRIQLHSSNRYVIKAAQHTIPLEDSRKLLCSRIGYQCLVDLISHFNCLYQACPVKIYDRLNHLRSVHQEAITPLDPLETEIAAYLSEDIDRELWKRLDWWRNNTIAVQES